MPARPCSYHCSLYLNMTRQARVLFVRRRKFWYNFLKWRKGTEITNCPRWCSGITRSVSQATRAWTFLILSMETGDNQEQYEREGHISQRWQYSWPHLYMGHWCCWHPLLLCNCQLFCSLLSEWSGAVNTKSYHGSCLSLVSPQHLSLSRIWTVLCDILLKFSDGSLCGRGRYDNFIVMSPAL